MSALCQLLDPIQAGEFFRRYRDREYLYVGGRPPSFYDGIVKLEDLDLLLQSGMLSSAFVNVVVNGVRKPLEEWARFRYGKEVERELVVQGVVGSSENKLSFATQLANSQISSFSAAQSRIRDADMASEAANLTKAQVLQQASIAAMAQANSAPQAVLALLK